VTAGAYGDNGTVKLRGLTGLNSPITKALLAGAAVAFLAWATFSIVSGFFEATDQPSAGTRTTRPGETSTTTIPTAAVVASMPAKAPSLQSPQTQSSLTPSRIIQNPIPESGLVDVCPGQALDH